MALLFYHPKTTFLERPFQSDRLPSQSNYLRAIVQAAVRVTNLEQPSPIIPEQSSQSDRLRAIVSLEEEVLGLKEDVSVLEDRTDRRLRKELVSSL